MTVQGSTYIAHLTTSTTKEEVLVVPRAYKRGKGHAPHIHGKIKKWSYK